MPVDVCVTVDKTVEEDRLLRAAVVRIVDRLRQQRGRQVEIREWEGEGPLLARVPCYSITEPVKGIRWTGWFLAIIPRQNLRVLLTLDRRIRGTGNRREVDCYVSDPDLVMMVDEEIGRTADTIGLYRVTTIFQPLEIY